MQKERVGEEGLRFKKTLLISDMDGTLSLSSRYKISPENRKALEYYVENGGLFTLATGRFEIGVQPYIGELPVNLPAILYNGAVIYDFKRGEVLWQDYLSDEVEPVIRDIMEYFPETGIEIFHGGDVYFLRQSEETERHRINEGFTPHIVSSMEEVPKPWYKAILGWKPQRLPEIEEFLKGRMKSSRSVYSEPHFLELLSATASKGHALNMLLKLMNLEDYKVVAMGDNMNDMELIKMAGTGVAVDNAHPELKKAAAFCCCHHDNHAVAEVIRWIEENL